jgi:hypothetical protein
MTHDSELDRTAEFDAGEHAYEKGDVVDLAEDGLWRVEKLERLTTRSSLN